MTRLPKEEDFRLHPGIYHAQITAAEEKRSQAGDLMWVCKLAAIDFGMQNLCMDRLMIEGKGAGITVRKLKALLPGRDDAEAHELIGKRVYTAVREKEYQGKIQLEVDIGVKGSEAGYWTTKPEGVAEPAPEPPPPF